MQEWTRLQVGKDDQSVEKTSIVKLQILSNSTCCLIIHKLKKNIWSIII